jgi:hypothetical protein
VRTAAAGRFRGHEVQDKAGLLSHTTSVYDHTCESSLERGAGDMMPQAKLARVERERQR